MGYLISITGITLPFLILYSDEIGIPIAENNKGSLYISASILIVGGFVIVTLSKLKNGNVRNYLENQNTDKYPMKINNFGKVIGIVIAGFFLLSLLVRLFMYSYYIPSFFVAIVCIIVLIIIVILLLLIIKRLKNNGNKNVIQFIIDEIKNMAKNKTA
jgi:hypothetical protein